MDSRAGLERAGDSRRRRPNTSISSRAACKRIIRITFLVCFITTILLGFAPMHPETKQRTYSRPWLLPLASGLEESNDHTPQNQDSGTSAEESQQQISEQAEAKNETSEISQDEWAWEPPIVLTDKMKYASRTYLDLVESALRSIGFRRFPSRL